MIESLWGHLQDFANTSLKGGVSLLRTDSKRCKRMSWQWCVSNKTANQVNAEKPMTRNQNPRWLGQVVYNAKRRATDGGDTAIEWLFTSASNLARQSPKEWSVLKARWEANKCSKHFSYRLKGQVQTERLIPMTSVMLLVGRIYQLKSGHVPTRVYLTLFSHRDDNKCWWCKVTVPQKGEHLFRHCSRWRHQQSALYKAIGKVKGWNAGRCGHVQVLEVSSLKQCD